jgi:hypothetical protein
MWEGVNARLHTNVTNGYQYFSKVCTVSEVIQSIVIQGNIRLITCQMATIFESFTNHTCFFGGKAAKYETNLLANCTRSRKFLWLFAKFDRKFYAYKRCPEKQSNVYHQNSFPIPISDDNFAKQFCIPKHNLLNEVCNKSNLHNVGLQRSDVL